MTNSTAPLAIRPNAPAAFGSRDEIKAIADRISVMLPSAHLSEWQAKRDDHAILQKRLDESVYRAAQLCVFYRLVPGEDVHVIPFGDAWAVDLGIESWKKSADRYCAQHGITYHIVTEDMSLDELKERRGENYHPDDSGVVAYLWRSDKKDVYDIFGAKESMSRACGVWAVKAKLVKGDWKPDTIPTQRSKQDVAKRRAMKAVLKLEFSLDSLLAATPAEMRQNLDAINMSLRAIERSGEIVQYPRTEVDENGFVVIPSQATRYAPRTVEFVVGGEPDADETFALLEGMPDVDEIEDAALVDDDLDIAYAALADKLSGNEQSFVRWAKQTHMDGTGHASIEQYRFLVGTLNAITGQADSHRLLLGVMIGRPVSSDNRPASNLAAKLLDWLVKESKDEVTGAKMPNPSYRPDYAECIRNIYTTTAAQTLTGHA